MKLRSAGDPISGSSGLSMPQRRAAADVRRRAALALGSALSLTCLVTQAQTVSLGGSLGDRALLVIDGTPSTVAAGATVKGVKLISVDGSQAVVEVSGKRVTLPLGGAQVNLGGADSGGAGSRIVISAGSGGHFFSPGAINGKAVYFLVDTGATNVSMSVAEAQRLGIDYTKGQRGMSSTANGQIGIYRVSLSSVRVGDVTIYNVDATVFPAAMETILLGNSFLSRFQMKRENDVMVLDKRF